MMTTFLKGFSILMLGVLIAACQHTTLATTSQNTALPYIEQVKNIDTVPKTSKGNLATLLKDAYGFCLIEFKGLHQTAEVTEHWAFNHDRLLSATTTTSHYADTQIEGTKKTFAEVESTPFDTKDADVIKNFEILKQYFKAQNIEQCTTP